MELTRSDFCRGLVIAGGHLLVARWALAEGEPVVATGTASGRGFVMATARVKARSQYAGFRMTLWVKQRDARGEEAWRGAGNLDGVRRSGTFSTRPERTSGGEYRVKCAGQDCEYEVLIGFRADSASSYKIIGRGEGSF